MIELSFRRVLTGWLLPVLLMVVSLVTVSIYPQLAIADDFTKATLGSMDFSGKDLTSYEFTQASVRGGKFINANLTGVSLIGGDFDSADFSGANMTNTALDTTRLTRANLTNTIFVGAFTTNTNFNGAIIDGADFTDVMLRKDVQKLLCKTAKGTNPTTGRVTRETLECP
jgi:uncharacterized protein YjbI with pentapeptide repeats